MEIISQKESYNNSKINDDIKSTSEQLELLKREISKNIVGNNETINSIIIAILCNGHILLEGVPGIAKTTMIKTIANSLGLDFKRIQFTPDLLPADLIGTLIFNPKTHDFETKKGPIFANIILADEINRAPAKVQSALLESMQEHQVTIGSSTFKLEEPFFVFATQNPIEQEGTYQLPEAQLDRFMFKLLISYPTKIEEKEIIKNSMGKNVINNILKKEDIFNAQQLVKTIYVDEKIVEYILNIIAATRGNYECNSNEIKNYIEYGASPRAAIALYHACRAFALLKKRYFVIPDDIKTIAFPILRHRIILSYEAQSDGITTDDIIRKILNVIPAP